VDISAALTADLAALTQALGNDDIDLETQLRAVADDVKLAVSAFTGLTMTIGLDGHTVSFTVREHGAGGRPAATSLLLPLGALTATDPASTLLLLAATPGAFIDLAADLSYSLGIDPATIVLDRHLSTDVTESGLDTHIAIDRAVGVLIDRGHTPGAARVELERRAGLEHGGLRAVAEQIIRTVGGGNSDTT
jgi:hypothetical protein